MVICLERGANDMHMVLLMSLPIISCFIKIQNGLPFWCQLTQVVLEKRPLNGCNISNSSNINTLCTEPYPLQKFRVLLLKDVRESGSGNFVGGQKKCLLQKYKY